MKQLDRDGVKLCYEEAGGGDPPLLFVHGWCCDHSYFALQVGHFKARHRAVSVDLRGHGASDKPVMDYRMSAFADDLAWLCRQLGLDRPVVVGHSMGGAIALVMAAEFQETVRGVVMIDSPVVTPAAVREARRPFIAALNGPACREAAASFISERLFIPTDDPARKARILASMLDVPQHVMASAMARLWDCDTESAAVLCKQPLLYIGADIESRTDFALFRELAPQLLVGQTVGAGHFNLLEVPDQVNAMIETFLAKAFAAVS